MLRYIETRLSNILNRRAAYRWLNMSIKNKRIESPDEIRGFVNERVKHLNPSEFYLRMSLMPVWICPRPFKPIAKTIAKYAKSAN